MQTLQVTIKNNKAIKMLDNMRELDLIDYSNAEQLSQQWETLFKKIRTRSKGEKMPMSEITKEVELVRQMLHDKGE